MLDKNLLELGINFHGHKCPAMPLGIRAGVAAMKTLEVERASNKELFCYVEAGPAHAALCFIDGIQVATGCTYGKGTIEKLNYAKQAIILIDLKRQKAVRVSVNPEMMKKAMQSKFVQLRKEGTEPKDIPAEIIDPMLKNITSQPDEALFKISGVFDYNCKLAQGSFEYIECQDCGELVYAPGVRLVNGKHLCHPCASK